MLTLSGCVSRALAEPKPRRHLGAPRRYHPDAPRRWYKLSYRALCGEQCSIYCTKWFNYVSRMFSVFFSLFYSWKVCFICNEERVWDIMSRGEKGLNIFAHLSVDSNRRQISLIWTCGYPRRLFHSLYKPQYGSCVFSTSIMHLKPTTSTHTPSHTMSRIWVFPCFHGEDGAVFQSVIMQSGVFQSKNIIRLLLCL